MSLQIAFVRPEMSDYKLKTRITDEHMEMVGRTIVLCDNDRSRATVKEFFPVYGRIWHKNWLLFLTNQAVMTRIISRKIVHIQRSVYTFRLREWEEAFPPIEEFMKYSPDPHYTLSAYKEIEAFREYANRITSRYRDRISLFPGGDLMVGSIYEHQNLRIGDLRYPASMVERYTSAYLIETFFTEKIESIMHDYNSDLWVIVNDASSRSIIRLDIINPVIPLELMDFSVMDYIYLNHTLDSSDEYKRGLIKIKDEPGPYNIYKNRYFIPESMRNSRNEYAVTVTLEHPHLGKGILTESGNFIPESSGFFEISIMDLNDSEADNRLQECREQADDRHLAFLVNI